MKLIQQSKLYFKEGNSDKVYEIDLCQLSDNEYLVNFRYGRKGSTLKAGTKTPEAVSLEKAEAVFAALENEKRKKGYQPEVGVTVAVELPSIETVNPGTPQGVILQRLQDAIDGKKTFKTEWKTSRVIWRAAEMGMKEAIPFILRLATQGTELQTYSSLWALIKLNAENAEPLFTAIASQQKQKAYIKHIACEGLLTVLQGNELAAFVNQLLERMPSNIRQDIELGNNNKLSAHLTEYVNDQNVAFLSQFYLLCKAKPELLPHLHNILKVCPFEPPFFKHIRSVYKLAQVRKDLSTLSLLAYRFEKESPMFKRSSPLDSRYHQYIQRIDTYLRVGSEIKSEESRIAFSQYTKAYFQRNSLNFLKKAGDAGNATEYIQLAVSLLLQYTEADYTKEEERPYSEYGIYNYTKKLYYYILVQYPECCDLLLLSNILFGNDPRRQLQKNLKYIYGKRTVASQQYWYQPDKIIAEKGTTTSETTTVSTQPTDSGKSLLGAIKSFFGGKKEEEEPQLQQQQPEAPVEEKTEPSARLELYPELWDKMPNAYVQLLMQAKMNIIHRFAYENLRNHTDYQEISKRFTPEVILQLLSREFKIPNILGYELLLTNANEIKKQPQLVARILDTNSAKAREWAQRVVSSDMDYYMSDFDFVQSLISNSRKENHSWIADTLQKYRFTEDRQQALLGKLVAELLQLENTDANNALAKMIISRINIIAAGHLSKISWDIVEQLILSPLLSNILLASNILTQKAQRINPTDIPVSVIDLFMRNDIAEVRKNGIQLMNLYPTNFLVDNYNFVLNQIDSAWQDVVENALVKISELVKGYSMGDATVRHFNYALIRKEKFEGAHNLLSNFMLNNLKGNWNTGLTTKDITKLVHAQYRTSQLTGYEILKAYTKPEEFTLGQIISFGNHELLAVRHWCWQYFKEHVARIRFEKDKALNILDSKWDDTREFAFKFFLTEFTESDWDSDTLIGIVDSIRPDVENFGKELIGRYFNPTHAVEYLTKLSEHPSVNVQAFVTNYLNHYAAGNTEIIRGLEYYFRSVLTRVNKARVAKDRILKFLLQEAMKCVGSAKIIAPIIDDISAQATIQDKATCINILTEIRSAYPHIDTHLIRINN
ncbi:WGR domain-containing protein [Bacteroides sp. 519]|uniref:WGR domain-containing protein n=1 Tax=Bacteroides sp. 519 TaxID=2302937 RepID=UPI0013D83DF3|nr:WGR domain-containing protein [Bacteroides sp. 519]NDV58427.1 WGR domain-containing protein [Bacteroides sp. 519]